MQNEDLPQPVTNQQQNYPIQVQSPQRKPNRLLLPVLVALALIGLSSALIVATKDDSSKVSQQSQQNIAAEKALESTAPPDLEPAQVSISAAGFVPETVTVKEGQAVVWTNTDTAGHIVASDPYPSNSILPDLNSRQEIGTGGTYSYIFSKKGTFTYHDNTKPQVTGTVVVE